MGTTSPDRNVIPNLVDHNATQDPDRIIYTYYSTSDLTEKHDVTNAQFADAVNRAAWILRDAIGEGILRQRIAYIGPSDLRYMILMLAALKTGCCVS